MSVALMPILVFVMLVVGALVFGLSKGGRRVVIAALIVLAVLIAGGLLSLSAVRFSQPPRMVVPQATPIPSAAPWLPAIADASSIQTPYISATTLLNSVSERTLAAVQQVAGDSKQIRVVGNENPLDLRKELFERVKQPFRFVNLSEQPEPPATRPSDEVWVSMRWQNHERLPVEWSHDMMERGTLVVEIAGPSGSANVTADLDEKPWLTNANLHPGSASYWVAAAPGAASSEQEAKTAVREAAISHTVALLRARVMATPGASVLSDNALRQQAEAAMVNDDALVDQCLVRIDKPYGQVWYAAMLRDTRVQSLDASARAAVVHRTQERQSWASMAVALGGMMLVLALVYAGLNAMTRGYFQFHLRAAIAVVLVVAAAVILLFMG